VAVARLIAYLVGVASMGTIAQGAVGDSLHDVVWQTHVRTVAGEERVVTETTTLSGVTVTRPGNPQGHGARPTTPKAGTTTPATRTRTRTRTTTVTVPGPTTTTTLAGEAVTTTVSGETKTVSAPGTVLTTTVPGPTVTTTVPGPMRTTTVAGPAVTTTVQGATATVTVTVTAACDPPPKKPVDPPCPPHK